MSPRAKKFSGVFKSKSETQFPNFKVIQGSAHLHRFRTVQVGHKTKAALALRSFTDKRAAVS